MTEEYKGIFAHHYHIRPWEMGLLTVLDFDNLVKSYEDYVAESRKEG
jgi:hypothetical protein